MKTSLFNAKVISNKEIAPKHYLLECEVPEGILALPGQFLQLHLFESGQFLRRPFSIFDQAGNLIKILYKQRGQVTHKLSKAGKDNIINLICPLGNGFPELEAENIIFISGGTGFAPLFFLAKKHFKRNQKMKFLIGSKGKEAGVFGKFIESLEIETMIASEDGSVGEKGLVTVLLNEIKVRPDFIICSAGPLEMLKNIFNFAQKNRIKTYFSLESHFACGLGFCWGCVIKTDKGFLRICKEGPVFEGDAILWQKL